MAATPGGCGLPQWMEPALCCCFAVGWGDVVFVKERNINKKKEEKESCWLLQADRVRLDAFQAYFLRRIFRILPSYFSRVSNLSVRERAYQSSFCSLLENRQVRLFNKIQPLPCTNFTKRLVCDTNGMPKLWHNRRSRGRPCQIWSTSVYRLIHPTWCDCWFDYISKLKLLIRVFFIKVDDAAS